MDRISEMPEEILAHIMSFLTTKESVQTGILAQRWRRTWASVPVLIFDLNEWIDGDTGPDNSEKRKLCEKRFNQFVNGVLENRGQSRLDVFRFTSSSDTTYSEISPEWLERIVLLMPWVIDVSTDTANVVDIPDSVFSCTSLEELYLDLLCTIDTTIIRPELINLPSLKKLEVHGVQFKDDFSQQLFSGCPFLESLTIGCCILNSFDISSDVLRKLVLTDCWHDKQLQISCPNLDSLVIESEDQGRGILLKDMASLVRAEYCLELYMFAANSAMNLLSGIPNVSTLKLDLQCPQFKEMLEKDITGCKTFDNLRSLEIMHWNMCYDFGLVAYFLKHSPCLQILTFHLNEIQKVYPEEELSEEEMGEVELSEEKMGEVKLIEEEMGEGELSEEELREVVPVFQREHLETIRIVKSGTSEALVEQLINNFHASIKTIGNITIS